MPYTLYYTAEDSNRTWTVRAEDYPEIDSVMPVEGTDRLVAAGLMTEDRADEVARRHQVRSYAVPTCDADPSSWFARGMLPRCKCGFNPKDNGLLIQHWADAGFRVVDENGHLVSYPIEKEASDG